MAAILPRAVLRHVGHTVLGQSEQAFVELAHAAVYFTVAIGTKHHALRELGDDLLPRTRYPILADAEILHFRVQMVEIEDHSEAAAAASETYAAHVCDRARLRSPAKLDDWTAFG